MRICYNLSIIIIFLLFATGNALAKRGPITIRGTTSDTSIHFIQIATFSQFYWDLNNFSKILGYSDRTYNNAFQIVLHLDQPQIVYLQTIGSSWGIYVTPGDSVNFTIINSGEKSREHKIHFSGANAANYNFYPSLNQLIMPDFDDPQFTGKIDEYKGAIESNLKIKMKFLSEYQLANQLSTNFDYIIKQDIRYEYCVFLYRPIFQNRLKKKDLPSDYFSSIQNLQWNNDSLLSIPKFRVALVTRNIYCYNEKPWESLPNLVNNIKLNFTSKVRQYLISAVFDIFARKQPPLYEGSFDSLIMDSQKYLTDSVYEKRLVNANNIYYKFNKPIPENIINSTSFLVFGSDSTISLSELLKKFNKQCLYIDFWASWCGACLQDISESEEANHFLKERKVIHVYISLDKNKDQAKWVRASKRERITKNQFLLTDDFFSPLAKYFTINYLPRYVLLDDNHNVKNMNAERPNRNSTTRLKEEVLTMQAKPVTFK